MEMSICIEEGFQRVMRVLVLRMGVLVSGIGSACILLEGFAKMEKVASLVMVMKIWLRLMLVVLL
jgi:hypothetical protein